MPILLKKKYTSSKNQTFLEIKPQSIQQQVLSSLQKYIKTYSNNCWMLLLISVGWDFKRKITSPLHKIWYQKDTQESQQRNHWLVSFDISLTMAFIIQINLTRLECFLTKVPNIARCLTEKFYLVLILPRKLLLSYKTKGVMLQWLEI